MVYNFPVGFINLLLIEVHVNKSNLKTGVCVTKHSCDGVHRDIKLSCNGGY